MSHALALELRRDIQVMDERILNLHRDKAPQRPGRRCADGDGFAHRDACEIGVSPRGQGQPFSAGNQALKKRLNGESVSRRC